MSKKYQDRLAKSAGTSRNAFESDYGKRILLKYGWQEGEGLGRKRNGRTSCIQATRRDEKQGLGAEKRKAEDQWDNWWSDCFNSVAKKLVVTSTDAAASESDSDSSDDEPPKKGSLAEEFGSGSVTCIKKAGMMQGKLRRVLRQDRAVS